MGACSPFQRILGSLGIIAAIAMPPSLANTEKPSDKSAAVALPHGLLFSPPAGWVRSPVPIEFQRVNIVAGWSPIGNPGENGGADNVSIMIEPFAGTLAAFRVRSERVFHDPSSGVIQVGTARAVQLCHGEDGYELDGDLATPVTTLHIDVVIAVPTGFGFSATSTYRGERRPNVGNAALLSLCPTHSLLNL